MNDALEILNEIEELANSSSIRFDEASYTTLILYVTQKRTEFEPAHGDCCG